MKAVEARRKKFDFFSRLFSRICHSSRKMVIAKSEPFTSGVVEGFYGRPWTCKQRRELFVRMQKWNMNTYVYAPKDDLKHRSSWRLPYTSEEEAKLKLLIQSADACDVVFVYAISPGLDIVFSNPADVAALKRKMKQVMKLGCKAFAVLFDDIDPKLKGADASLYSSSAIAQASLTNELHSYLKRPKFLFCPTEYCKTRALPTIRSSEYLNTIGNVLNEGIHIMWTGNKVIPNSISTDSIAELSAVLKRKPIIWDNIHANDYDQRRVFLGPYAGRPIELYPLLDGVLSNPNCEFEANYIPLHTLATWCRVASANYKITASSDVVQFQSHPVDSFDDLDDVTMAEDCIDCPSDCSMNVELTPLSAGEVEQFVSPYDPQQALDLAIEDWVLEFGCEKSAERRSYAKRNVTSSTTTDGQVVCTSNGYGIDCEGYVPEGPTTSMKRNLVLASDIRVLVDLFYLPYCNGTSAQKLLDDFQWLKDNHKFSSFADMLEPRDKVSEWIKRVSFFQLACQDIYNVFVKLSKIPNEAIIYDLYPYLWDAKEAVLTMDTHVQWMCRSDIPCSPSDLTECNGLSEPAIYPKECITDFIEDDFVEAWHNMFLGGITVAIHRSLPFNGGYLFLQDAPDTPCSQTIKIRPYDATDKKHLYELCGVFETDSLPSSLECDFSGDKHLGPYLSSCASTVFVIEDDQGICGVAAAAPDNKAFYECVTNKWQAELRTKYVNEDSMKCSLLDYSDWFPLGTSHLVLVLSSRAKTPDVVKRAFSSILSVLKSVGSTAVYLEADKCGLDSELLSRLGFYRMDIPNKEIVGRCL